jgi:hypothetical protein
MSIADHIGTASAAPSPTLGPLLFLFSLLQLVLIFAISRVADSVYGERRRARYIFDGLIADAIHPMFLVPTALRAAYRGLRGTETWKGKKIN